MKQPPRDDRIQDYLDGRLAEDERADLERRLREDADAAEHVDVAREIGAALREDPGELSPDFYARTRARFEREHDGHRGRRGLRILSWESFGLAAAALLAVAVFLPTFVREGARGPIDLLGSEVDRAQGLEKRSPGEQPAASGPPVEEVGRVEDRLVRVKKEDLRREKKQEKNEPWAPVPGLRARQDAPTRAPDDAGTDPAAPAEQRSATGKTKERRTQAREPAPRPGVASSAQARAETEELDEDRYQRDAEAPPPPAEELQAGRESDEGRVAKSAELAGSIAPARAVPLPEGLARAGEVRTITDRVAWGVVRVTVDDQTRRAIGPHDPEKTLILIGPTPEGLDCSTVGVVETEKELQVRAGSGNRADPGGCALVIERADKPVVLLLEGRE